MSRKTLLALAAGLVLSSPIQAQNIEWKTLNQEVLSL